MANDVDAIQIVTTASSRAEADTIAKALVTRRLAACAQVAGPITSTYHWKGNLETSEEWMCVIKTLRSHYAMVEATIRELHSYGVPEVLAFEVLEGSQSYLDWLVGEVGPPGSS